jgi:transcriptional regulator with XRE-family HTH domain
MSIGQRIKKIINEYDLTQEEIASKINTTRQRIGNVINGKNQPNSALLSNLCKAYKVSNCYGVVTASI